MDEFDYAKGGHLPGSDRKTDLHRGEYVLSLDSVRVQAWLDAHITRTEGGDDGSQ